MEILGLLQPFITIYKEIKFFFDIFVYNPLNLGALIICAQKR